MAVVMCLSIVARAGTIVYAYDEQHRLAAVNYNDSATVTYRYDKANNLTRCEVLTEEEYLTPFLLYLTWRIVACDPLLA